MQKPAVFLDRDGVIVENRSGYVKNLDDFQFISHATEAIELLCQSKIYVFVITNQGGIGKGQVSLDNVLAINGHMINGVRAHGGHIDDVFICPHHPEDGCYCRKPKPGLFLQAFNTYKNINRRKSFMIGDSRSDILAAESVGINPIMVRTGRGEKEIEKYDMIDVVIKNDLFEAAEFINTIWLNAKRKSTNAAIAK